MVEIRNNSNEIIEKGTLMNTDGTPTDKKIPVIIITVTKAHNNQEFIMRTDKPYVHLYDEVVKNADGRFYEARKTMLESEYLKIMKA